VFVNFSNTKTSKLVGPIIPATCHKEFADDVEGGPVDEDPAVMAITLDPLDRICSSIERPDGQGVKTELLPLARSRQALLGWPILPQW
jgi:hypothetical protein